MRLVTLSIFVPLLLLFDSVHPNFYPNATLNDGPDTGTIRKKSQKISITHYRNMGQPQPFAPVAVCLFVLFFSPIFTHAQF